MMMKRIHTFESFLNEANKFQLKVLKTGLNDALALLRKEDYSFQQMPGKPADDFVVINFPTADELEAATEFLGTQKDRKSYIHESFLNEAINEANGWIKSKGRAGEITVDNDQEAVRLDTDSGFIEIGNIFDKDGPAQGIISIYAMDNSPQGYTSVKVSDLKRLITAYNKAEWSENKI